MDLHWTGLFLVVPWLHISSGVLRSTSKNYTTALAYCQLRGEALVSYIDEKHLSQIENELKQRNITKVRLWTSVTVVLLPRFVWLGGQSAPVNQTSLYECGHLNTITDSLSSSDCSVGRHGFICQYKITSDFSCEDRCETMERMVCYPIDGACYVARCPQRGREKTWLAAEKECAADDGHLAQPVSKSAQALLSSKLEERQDSECREYSLGFKNFELINNESGAEVPPKKLNWAKSWSHYSPECITVTIEIGQNPLWTPTPCSEGHSFQCVKVSSSSVESKNSTKNSTRSTHSKNSEAIIAGSTIGAIVLAAILVFVVVVCIKKRRRLGAHLKKGSATEAEIPLNTSTKSEQSFTVEELKRRKYGIDPTHKEQYLSEEDFQREFNMSKEDFALQPEWKQIEMKKDAGLF